MLQSTKLGLVLSGGGAKGAFQAGVLRYLAEQNIQPDAVSGASIGSLNGSVVAGSRNVQEAAETLEKVWHEVAENSPLKMDFVALLAFMMRIAAAALGGPIGRKAAASTQILGSVLPEKYHKYIGTPAFFDNSPSVDILKRYAGLDSKDMALPFWASVYESDGIIKDISQFIASSLDVYKESKASSFILINNLSPDAKLKALLASSAIPLAYEAQRIDGKKFYDGGMGGGSNFQGNTPIVPLIENEKCSHIIVTHLQDGTFWDRNKFPNTSILEIRPRGISKGSLDMLNFERGAILEWMEQGYQDAKASIEPVAEGLAAFRRSRETHAALSDSASNMADALQWLKD
ncbi:patatin-like phospholipase family protein [Pseudomonas jilinensis]|uniref:PNPLA domain-containing protein n=1 Tax=Pseudomonas jilinensis TaxID=2078689 RepID=A0A396S3V2_9PSED|nr:patatin-like phospholipase family protein [Pseudomonas jilinensis]RHW21393.1 hypothetical protein C2846_09765 [Pseudomonas jilinensis]